MEEKLSAFLELSEKFENNGLSLFLVGGTVRDYLLEIPLSDMDAVTDATPEEMKRFLPDLQMTFARFGSVVFKTKKKVKFDITTMRAEKAYSDSRHPAEISFVKDLNIDVKRRDFTVNALYMDKNLKVIDLVDGVKDIKSHTLRMVGDPEIRLKEDPLRIIRALRFSADYDLKIEPSLSNAIKNNIGLLEKLNIEKINQDIKKTNKDKKVQLIQLFEEYDIKHLLDVLNY